MHYITLAAVNFSPTEEDEITNGKIIAAIEQLKHSECEHDIKWINKLRINRLSGQISSFSRSVEEAVKKIMDPYGHEPEDTRFVEFWDATEDIRSYYESKTDCLRLPDGRIVEADEYRYRKKYRIRDGKVYQLDAGPLHHEKRTKKARKLTALPNYPRAKLYKSFESCAEDALGYCYNEELNKYGYFENTMLMWDWYQIGGRWPNMFLVRASCKEFSKGVYSWTVNDEDTEAPEGYKWAAAARKKDICWEAMRDWRLKRLKKLFEMYERWFVSGKVDAGFCDRVTGDGVECMGGLVYRKAETFGEFIQSRSTVHERRYPLCVHDIVDADGWQYPQYNDTEYIQKAEMPADWCKKIDDYIDSLNNETVLVGVDYHM